ncbi:MAG: hypothetical protein ACLQBK_20530 [Candidatus Sulfotelmatobacter sp.]
MTRCWAILLVIAISFASLPASAQELVSHKLLPPPAALRAGIQNFHASFGQETGAPAKQPARQKHWTKGGKIMTYIGAGLMAGGAGALAYGLSNQNSANCIGTCIAVDWKWTGVAWLAGGSVLTVIGLTRRSTD